MGVVPEGYREQARAAYQALAEPPPMFTTAPSITRADYWTTGTTFDTMTDYLLISGDPAQHLARDVDAAYDHGAGCWYDDFGWWGIASAKAFDPAYKAVFVDADGRDFRRSFQLRSIDCWNTMNAGTSKPPGYRGAPNVWENRDPRTFAAAPPRFLGGVWQYEIYTEPRPNDPCAPDGDDHTSDPRTTTLGPFQNTVTNALYLVLALRMYLFAGINDAPEAAQREYAFLQTWFSQNLGDESLLARFAGGSAFVRERVGTYAGGKPVNAYAASNVWCGDQGLTMGGLLVYAAAFPGNPAARSVAFSILHAVATRPELRASDGSLQGTDPEWTLGDPGDYDYGVGVFMRYLLHAFLTDAQVRSEVLAIVRGDPKGNFVAATAAGLSAGFDPPPPKVPGNRVTYCNVLAALTAAIAILGAA